MSANPGIRRGAIAAGVVVALLGAARLTYSTLHQRSARASDHLKSLVLELDPLAKPGEADCLTAQLTPKQPLQSCPGNPDACDAVDALIRCGDETKRLPVGLAAGTVQAAEPTAMEDWLKGAVNLFRSRPPTVATCLGLSALSTQLSRNGGARGERYGSRLLLLSTEACALALWNANSDQREAARHRLDAMVVHAPDGKRLVQLLSMEAQVHRFGTWLRPIDLEALPEAVQAFAAQAPPQPDGFRETQRRLGLWVQSQHQTETLSMAVMGPEREPALVEFEHAWSDRLSAPGSFREALDEERQRVTALKLLAASAAEKFDCAKSSTPEVTAERNGTLCQLSSGTLHVQLPIRSE